MKAMTSFTVKSLRDSAARTIVTIAGVALAAALLVAVLSSYVSATDYLLRNEATANGTWMSQVILPDDEKTREEIASAEDATDVKALATLQDVGFAGLSDEQRVTLGIYLPILTGDGPIEELCGVRVAEGRLPQNAAEIMLPSIWQRNSTIALGDTITLDVGNRQAVLAPGEQGSMSGGSYVIDDYDPEFASKGYSIEDGSNLNSSMGYLDSEADNSKFDEKLVDVTERSYTVVGFAATDNWTLMTGAGAAALTVDESATGDIPTFLELSSISTEKQVRERTSELFGDTDIQTHINLLRYMGISDHAPSGRPSSTWWPSSPSSSSRLASRSSTTPLPSRSTSACGNSAYLPQSARPSASCAARCCWKAASSPSSASPSASPWAWALARASSRGSARPSQASWAAVGAAST